MITRKFFEYHFDNLKMAPWNQQCFSVIFKSSVKALSGMIADNSCGFSIGVRNARRNETDARIINKCNYFFEKDSCPVLEASAVFAEEDTPYIIGFPLHLIGDGDAVHEFAVIYDGVWFNLFCDGILYDRDSPHGGALTSQTPPVALNGITAVISGSVDGIQKIEKWEQIDIPLHCYTPAGFNTWAGDVTVCSFNGKFHIFYLYDLHHHGSRKGRGAHVFCHLSSSDLINWTDHGEVVGIDKPYLTIGTGNAFVLNDKLHLAFGFHTVRSKPAEQCAGYLLRENFKKNNRVDAIHFDDLGNCFPGGASYSVSSNGIDFSHSNKIIHYMENPNITVMPDGSLRLCEHSIWKGENLDRWELVKADFPPKNQNSFSLHTTECPCFFTIDGQEFLLIGFTGCYRVEPDGSLTDLTSENLDPYDGMAVPMVTEYNGRTLICAWMNSPDWGSFLMLRELILLDNGGLGSRWVTETLPRGEFLQLETGKVFEIPEKQIDTKLEIRSSNRIKIKFSGNGEDCWLVVDREEQYAAWQSTADEKIEFFHEIAARRRDAESFRNLKDESIHIRGENYARKVKLPTEDFAIKIIIHNDPKFHGAAVDVEIAGRYTFATYRRNLKTIRSLLCC